MANGNTEELIKIVEAISANSNGTDKVRAGLADQFEIALAKVVVETGNVVGQKLISELGTYDSYADFGLDHLTQIITNVQQETSNLNEIDIVLTPEVATTEESGGGDPAPTIIMGGVAGRYFETSGSYYYSAVQIDTATIIVKLVNDANETETFSIAYVRGSDSAAVQTTLGGSNIRIKEVYAGIVNGGEDHFDGNYEAETLTFWFSTDGGSNFYEVSDSVDFQMNWNTGEKIAPMNPGGSTWDTDNLPRWDAAQIITLNKTMKYVFSSAEDNNSAALDSFVAKYRVKFPDLSTEEFTFTYNGVGDEEIALLKDISGFSDTGFDIEPELLSITAFLAGEELTFATPLTGNPTAEIDFQEADMGGVDFSIITYIRHKYYLDHSLLQNHLIFLQQEISMENLLK